MIYQENPDYPVLIKQEGSKRRKMKLREHNGKIYIRDLLLEEIADEYGTPFYLYDLNTIREKIYTVKKQFGDSIELLYAVKANSNLEILRAIRDHVDGLDISSAGEMDQSLLAGYNAKQLSFAGPGKTLHEIRKALCGKVGIMSVESLRELQDMRTVACAEKLKANIVLRVNPKLLIKEFTVKMGGKPTQFGIDEENIGSAIDYIRQNKNSFNFLGIHVYSGTQCMNEEAIARNVMNTLEIACNLSHAYAIECNLINLGGGFGVSYYEENREIDLKILGQRIKEALNKHVASTGIEPRIILELGRYLVADSGIYVTRVVREKMSRGETFFILDGGMNHHLAASGNLGATLRQNYLVKNLSCPGKPKETCNLVGPLCTPFDLMGKGVSIESPR